MNKSFSFYTCSLNWKNLDKKLRCQKKIRERYHHLAIVIPFGLYDSIRMIENYWFGIVKFQCSSVILHDICPCICFKWRELQICLGILTVINAPNLNKTTRIETIDEWTQILYSFTNENAIDLKQSSAACYLIAHTPCVIWDLALMSFFIIFFFANIHMRIRFAKNDNFILKFS